VAADDRVLGHVLDHGGEAVLVRHRGDRLVVAPRRGVAEEHRPERVDLEADPRLKAREQLAMFPRESLRGPAQQSGRVVLGLGIEHQAVAVAAHPAQRDALAELRQGVEHLPGQRPEHDVAADHHGVEALTLDLGEHSLEGGQVAVDVVESRDAHRAPSLAPGARPVALDLDDHVDERHEGGDREAPEEERDRGEQPDEREQHAHSDHGEERDMDRIEVGRHRPAVPRRAPG
jgi:hypothetical protein